MNSDVIRLLPDSVANMIAAGEVIQRPASVIKELVENSVDAGAKNIQIILKDAGRTLIQVVDDGCGMSPSDARMAFERHATSKISQASDLYNLHTMGFRGEALPSIAAVAQIDLRTMRRGDTVGTRLQLSESQFESQEPCTCVPGSNLSVKNIFFHMPARRKFLKKDSIELSHILREFERLALVNTDIDFTLIHNDVTLHQFMRGSLKQRIGSLFGKSMESQLAPISTETSIVKISGFVGMPRGAKRRGYQQFFFVNGRNMRSRPLHNVVANCYEHLIPADAQASYFINFEVDPATIDVNIHPQKHEIKFEHEKAIWQILAAAIKETLGKTQAMGAFDFEADEAPDIPLFSPDDKLAAPAENIDSGYNPFRRSGDYAPSVPRDWDALYDNFNRERADAFSAGFAPEADGDLVPSSDFFGATDLIPSAGQPALFVPEPEAAATVSPVNFQQQGRYIVGSSHSGIMIISQHRAHVRILYDRFLDQMNHGTSPSQKLIFAEEFELSPAQGAMLEATRGRFEEIGFAFENKGEGRWSMSAVPAALGSSNPVEALMNILEEVPQEDFMDETSFRSPLALSLARSAAIDAGQTLTAAEMECIIADLFRCSEPAVTPDGQTIISIVSNEEIASRFE